MQITHQSISAIATERQVSNFNKKFSIDFETGCWNWKTYIGKNGYGQFILNPKKVSAHRASWIIHKGEIPQGLFILHKCDNKKCVNPNHLFLGTQLENIRDAYSKGRGQIGKSHNYVINPIPHPRSKTNGRFI